MRLASIIPYVVQYTHLMNANYNIEEASVVENNDKNMVTTEEMTAQEEQAPKKRTPVEWVLHILKEYFYLYGGPLIAIILGLVIFQFGVVPTGSMEPNYHAGSFFVAFRLIDTENLDRGTPVVFKREDGVVYFKRAIGLPGDTITFADGNVYINGEELDESAYLEDGIPTDAGYCDEYLVPDGCYFMLGDNRLYSIDARYWENPYISADAISGRVLFTVKIPFWNAISGNE